ncbi:MAG TPA: carboxypeptidase-like regulatory domain-containing protein [Candidatus Thermoplasmatota archaeon]|nr:carboxypeptidase-like regulatory domain-containing protein [Candidatus Thermoplasmatota archaeon]
MAAAIPVRPAALALAFLLVAGAGCSGTSGGGGKEGPAGPPLQGYVFDQAVRPVVGATVSVQGANVANGTVKTGTDGHYAFPQLPLDERLVVTIQAAGLRAVSKQVSVTSGNSTFLNFTLEPLPTAKPYTEAQGFNGFLACETATTSGGQTQRTDCSNPQDPNKREWTLAINPGVQSIVFETAWEPFTPGSAVLHMTVHTTSGTPVLLAEVEGPSILRAIVSQEKCQKEFAQGGQVKVVWSAGTDSEQLEAGIAAATAVQQDFKAVATSFFVDPAPPDYSSG